MDNHQRSEKIQKKVISFFRKEWSALSDVEKRVVEAIIERKPISRNLNKADDALTFGERVSDRVAGFGGSWTFIISFVIVLLLWVVLNSFILASRSEQFDPYPYILLNLFLSMLAAIQAPVILMSQNRQAAKDRLDAQHDYEVNLKAEFEILGVHEKLDDLRGQKWAELIALQQKQIELLKEIVNKAQL